MGLGLVITKQIVEAHNGTLTCTSVRGQGATFILTLPVGDSQGSEAKPSSPCYGSTSGSVEEAGSG